jgi:predicted Zn-dependent protease
MITWLEKWAFSLFQVDAQQSSRVVVHGLGHNRGLRHHVEPIDVMYPHLLKSPVLEVEGFCMGCLRKLTHDETSTLN